MEIFNATNLVYILGGFIKTIEISVLSIICSVVVGTVLALVKSYGPRPFRWLVSAYIELFRCTPNLLWILFIYFTVQGHRHLHFDARVHVVHERRHGRDRARGPERRARRGSSRRRRARVLASLPRCATSFCRRLSASSRPHCSVSARRSSRTAPTCPVSTLPSSCTPPMS